MELGKIFSEELYVCVCVCVLLKFFSIDPSICNLHASEKVYFKGGFSAEVEVHRGWWGRIALIISSLKVIEGTQTIPSFFAPSSLGNKNEAELFEKLACTCASSVS